MDSTKALIIVVNAGFSEEIVDLARKHGAGGATILNARGEGVKRHTIMGITVDSEKEMVLSVTDGKTAAKIMNAVSEHAGIETPAHGVCFLIPVEKMTGITAN